MNQTIANILTVFSGFRMAPTAIDQYEAIGKNILAQKIEAFTSAGKPIEFSMLGIPFKSINTRDKTIGTMPDLGEELMFKNFANFGEKIKNIYSPGIEMHVVSDGYIFNDLMDVPDKTVQEYEEINKDLSREAPVIIHDLQDFYGGQSISSARGKVIQQFGITEQELERRILTDEDINFLYKGMIRFMQQDLAIKNYDSGNQLHKAAKKLAREMMFRNEAYSKLVQTEFSDKIRLSMHPSVNNGTKYSFQLIDSPMAFYSPWHCAIVKTKEGYYATIHRKDADAAGMELVNVGGRPYYFIEN